MSVLFEVSIVILSFSFLVHDKSLSILLFSACLCLIIENASSVDGVWLDNALKTYLLLVFAFWLRGSNLLMFDVTIDVMGFRSVMLVLISYLTLFFLPLALLPFCIIEVLFWFSMCFSLRRVDMQGHMHTHTCTHSSYLLAQLPVWLPWLGLG